MLGSHIQLITFDSIMLSVWNNDTVVQDQPLHSSAFTLRGPITAKRLLQFVSITWMAERTNWITFDAKPWVFKNTVCIQRRNVKLKNHFNSPHIYKSPYQPSQARTHMFCMTCAVSRALYSHERTGASDNQIYKGTAQPSAHHFTTHSPNDTLDALREHANASTCAPRMQLGRLADGRQNKAISWDALYWDASVPCAQILLSMNPHCKEWEDEICHI